MKIARSLVPVFLLLVMASCTTVELVKSAAQGIFSGDEKRNGVYKVGNPYQIEGRWYYPKEEPDYQEVGIASWYGDKFHKKVTANGEIFNKHLVSAAHRTLPIPSVVNVTNLSNGQALTVRINDRGPFAKDRIIDLSEKAADLLGFKDKGTQRVKVELDYKATQRLPLVRQEKEGKSYAGEPKKIWGQRGKTGRSYFVQVGAFGDKRVAKNMQEKLSEIPAVFVENVRGRDLHRVKIGPVRDDVSARKLLAIVRNKGFADAIIVKN